MLNGCKFCFQISGMSYPNHSHSLVFLLSLKYFIYFYQFWYPKCWLRGHAVIKTLSGTVYLSLCTSLKSVKCELEDERSSGSFLKHSTWPLITSHLLWWENMLLHNYRWALSYLLICNYAEFQFLKKLNYTIFLWVW